MLKSRISDPTVRLSAWKLPQSFHEYVIVLTLSGQNLLDAVYEYMFIRIDYYVYAPAQYQINESE